MKTLRDKSNMPIMEHFDDWCSYINLRVIRQKLVEGEVVEEYTDVKFRGTIQPMPAEILQLKNEGERSWKWYMIHCFGKQLQLNTNDVIVYKGKEYKVMQKWDYELNNYIEYEVIEKYSDE